MVYHHRGAATNAISNVLEWDMPKHAVYLWTLPMFHCNGWCFPWTVARPRGVNVCLRRVEARPSSMRSATTASRITAAPHRARPAGQRPGCDEGGVPAGVKAMVAGAAPRPR